MKTMNVSISDDLIAALVLAERKRVATDKLESLLLEGLKGPFLPVDQDFWDSMRREALEGWVDESINP